jgi:hypothetical protein
LFYDPVGRVVATIHPDHSYEKVIVGPWTVRTFDANDTVAPHGDETGDPRTDPDIKGYVAGFFATLPGWQTWFQQRITASAGSSDELTARRAAAHTDTPTMACVDPLGRTFVSFAHNGHAANGTANLVPTRSAFGVEGRIREVRDAIEHDGDRRGRLVVRWHYDMMGRRVHQASLDAGERWTLPDVSGTRPAVPTASSTMLCVAPCGRSSMTRRRRRRRRPRVSGWSNARCTASSIPTPRSAIFVAGSASCWIRQVS